VSRKRVDDGALEGRTNVAGCKRGDEVPRAAAGNVFKTGCAPIGGARKSCATRGMGGRRAAGVDVFSAPFQGADMNLALLPAAALGRWPCLAAGYICGPLRGWGGRAFQGRVSNSPVLMLFGLG
jgi:hypothetical protein